MAFLIPENVLETLTCYSCLKFLTVTPVKIDSDQKFRCGRWTCIKNDGVVSLYNKVISRSIFKCVNRLDGCKMLLNSSQITEHENICHPKVYMCFNCLNPTAVHTYQLFKHFQKAHSEENLGFNAGFTVDPKLRFNKSFLYRYNDNLFFINVRNEVTLEIDLPAESIDLRKQSEPEIQSNFSVAVFSCVYLGDASYKINFTFSNSNRYQEKEVFCNTLNVMRDQNNIRVYTTNEDTLRVQFAIDQLKSNKRILLLPNLDISSRDVSEEIQFAQPYLNVFMKEAYFKPRQIFIDTVTNNPLPGLKIRLRGSRLSDDLTHFILKRVNNDFVPTLDKTLLDKTEYLYFSCYNCSLLQYDILDFDSDCVRTIKIENSHYIVCTYCCSFRKDNRLKDQHKIISEKTFEKLHFLCLWGCGSNFVESDLLNHEKNCTNQPYRRCPVPLCTHFCRLFEVETHFLQIHSELPLPEFSSVLSLHLNPQKPINLFYMVVSHVYICVEIIWLNPFWKFTIKCDLPDVKPRGLLFRKEEFLFDAGIVAFIKEQAFVKHRSFLRLKCYLAHPDKVASEPQEFSN